MFQSSLNFGLFSNPLHSNISPVSESNTAVAISANMPNGYWCVEACCGDTQQPLNAATVHNVLVMVEKELVECVLDLVLAAGGASV